MKLVCTCIASVFLAAAMPAAHAADPPAKKVAPRSVAKSKPKLLTRDQLRACMDEQEGVQQASAKVKVEEASLEQPRLEVTSMDTEIARKLAALDPADAAARQALKEEEDRRNELADAYNARLRALREEAGTLAARRAAWAERCADKDYDERDEFAIKRERQRSASGAK